MGRKLRLVQISVPAGTFLRSSHRIKLRKFRSIREPSYRAGLEREWITRWQQMSWWGLDRKLFIKLRENHPDAHTLNIDAIFGADRAAVIFGDQARDMKTHA